MFNVTSHLLSQSSYWRLSKALVSELGLIKAFILTDIIDKYDYHSTKQTLNDRGYFFYVREEMLKLYPIGETKLRDCLKELHQDQLIDYYLESGVGNRKTYFTIIPKNIENLIDKYLIEKS